MVAHMVKNLPASAGERFPWVGKIPGEGSLLPSSILARRVPRTEGLGGFQSWCRKDFDVTERARTHTHTHTHTRRAPSG